MIKGKKTYTWEDILLNSQMGWDIFCLEIPHKIRLNKQFPSPLRTDRKPSCALLKGDEVWFMKDFSEDKSYTALQLVMERYGLSFKEALDKMAGDLGLSSKTLSYTKNIKAPEKTAIEGVIKPIHIDKQPWKKEHWEFWKNTEVTDIHCQKYNTYAVKQVAIARRRVPLKPKEVVWAYEHRGKFKLYFPERDKENRFKNNLHNTHLWHFDKIKPEWSQLRIQKSMKDLLVSTILDEQCIATQNESAQTLLEYNYDILNNQPLNKIICYGNDFHAWHESYIITHLTNWRYFNIPEDEEPKINDEYAFAKKYGIKELEKLYKLKNLI